MKATRDFQSTVLGSVRKGDPIPNDKYGEHLMSVGLAERDPEPEYETKVLRPKPKTRTGRGTKRKDKAAG